MTTSTTTMTTTARNWIIPAAAGAAMSEDDLFADMPLLSDEEEEDEGDAGIGNAAGTVTTLASVVRAKNFVYHEIRAKLAELGVPPEQVAFIQDHNTKAKRAALYAAVNRGDIRVLLCSKQTTGMNIQQRLVGLHHVDAPWRPGDVEQREGRIKRQGNAWPEVYVFAYVTEGSFDGYIWQTLETKARFIAQMKSGDVTIREVDDIGEAVLSAAEIKAIASGNPLVLRKVELDNEVSRLTAMAGGYRDEQQRLRRKLRDIPAQRVLLTERLTLVGAAQAAVAPHLEQKFHATVRRTLASTMYDAHTKREEAGQAMLALIDALGAEAKSHGATLKRPIGTYGGLWLVATAHRGGWDTSLSLCLPHTLPDGTDSYQPIRAESLNFQTAKGLYGSADTQIRDMPALIAGYETTLAALARDEEHLATLIDQPWPQAEQLAAAKAALESVNALLADHGNSVQHAASTEEDGWGDDGHDDAPCFAPTEERSMAAILPLLGLAPLPPVDNREAMQAAMRRLAGALPLVVPAPLAEAASVALRTATADRLPTEAAPITPMQPPVVVVATPTTPVVSSTEALRAWDELRARLAAEQSAKRKRSIKTTTTTPATGAGTQQLALF